MGMFDTVLFSCEDCGKMNEFQSKADECILGNYTIDNAPLSILVDMFYAGNIKCEHCGCMMRLDFMYAVGLTKVGKNLEWKKARD